MIRIGANIELEIAPKFLGVDWKSWREDFFFASTLSRHGRLLPTERLGAEAGPPSDLATLIARAFVTMYWDNHRRPLRTYRRFEKYDMMIDGDVDPESIVLPTPDGFAQSSSAYDRRNILNGAIHAAARALISEVTDPHARQQLVRITEALSPQAAVPTPRHRRLPNRSRRWQPLHDLAIDILKGFSIMYGRGAMASPGYVVDTWRVWEDVVTTVVRLACGAQNVMAQKPYRLGTRAYSDETNGVIQRPASVTPDVSWRGDTALLIDAKYKGRVGDVRNRISESDLYEALAFATAAKQTRVLLLYPHTPKNDSVPLTGTTTIFETIAVGDVRVIGAEIEVRGISRRGGLRSLVRGVQVGLAAAAAATPHQ